MSISTAGEKTRLIYDSASGKLCRVKSFAEPTFAWEPVTPRGVAAFARASLERLLLVQCVFAALAAAAVVWFLDDGIFPTVAAAGKALPAQGGIHAGKLEWTEDSPQLLAEGKIIAFSVDLEHGASLRSPADFQFEFGRTSVRGFGLFGETEAEYPPDLYLPANRPEIQPAWEAWAPDLLALAGIGTFLGLLVTWMVLATFYAVPVWGFCFFTNRDLNLRSSWKLAGAALMPGALLMSVALVFYELGVFDLVQFCFAFVMHLVLGWIYLFVSPMFLNRQLPAKPANPFAGQPG